MPLQETVVDFWQLLYEQKVSTIVMLNQTKSKESKEVNVHNMFECKLRTMHTQNQTTYRSVFGQALVGLTEYGLFFKTAQNIVYFFRILEYIGLTS